MQIVFLIVTILSLWGCVSKPDSLSSENASVEDFRSYIGYKNYVQVKYKKESVIHNEILTVKYKNKDGFGRSKDNLIPWNSLMFVKKLKKSRSELSEGVGNVFIISPLL